MSVIAAAVGDLSDALLTLGAGVRLTSDLDNDRDAITVGEVRHQISWSYNGVERSIDSNTRLYGYEVTIWIKHRLASAINELAWTGSDLCELLARTIGDPSWYGTAITGGTFFAMQAGSDAIVMTTMEREGNIIWFSARAKIILNA